MTVLTSVASYPPSAICLDPVAEIDDDQLFELCRRNRDLHIERTAAGELILMSPAGGKTSDRNAEIVGQLRNWAKRDGTGRTVRFFGWFHPGERRHAFPRCLVGGAVAARRADA